MLTEEELNRHCAQPEQQSKGEETIYAGSEIESDDDDDDEAGISVGELMLNMLMVHGILFTRIGFVVFLQ